MSRSSRRRSRKKQPAQAAAAPQSSKTEVLKKGRDAVAVLEERKEDTNANVETFENSVTALADAIANNLAEEAGRSGAADSSFDDAATQYPSADELSAGDWSDEDLPAGGDAEASEVWTHNELSSDSEPQPEADAYGVTDAYQHDTDCAAVEYGESEYGEPEDSYSEPTPAVPACSSPNENASAEILDSLQTLLQRFDQLDGRLDGWAIHGIQVPGGNSGNYDDSGDAFDVNGSASANGNEDELREDLLHLQTTLDEAWRANEELRHQNEMLAAQVAETSVRQTVQSTHGNDESLSWEERKALIMRQMEEETFDADEFVSSLSSGTGNSISSSVPETEGAEPVPPQSPQEFVESLIEKIERAERTIQKRDEEIGELRMLLESQSGTRTDGTAIGAAAIASMIDSDELVMEERERLQQLKNDWEDKFRQAEIEASLERAKLSRERQELAKRTQELEERLEEMQREKRDNPTPAKSGRRWLAELGLGGSDDS